MRACQEIAVLAWPKNMYSKLENQYFARFVIVCITFGGKSAGCCNPRVVQQMQQQSSKTEHVMVMSVIVWLRKSCSRQRKMCASSSSFSYSTAAGIQDLVASLTPRIYLQSRVAVETWRLRVLSSMAA